MPSAGRLAAPSTRVSAAALRALGRRSNRTGLLWLSGHAALIGVLAALVGLAGRTPYAWPAMLALGVVLMALFAPLHETTHRTPFRSLWLNRAVGYVAGLLLVLPPEWFRQFHLAHHRHAQDPARDPEITGAASLTRARYVLRLTGLPYWVAQIRVVATTALGLHRPAWLAPTRWRAVVWEARGYCAIYAALAAGSVLWPTDLLLRFYLIPALLGQPVLRAVLMAEHGGLPFVPDVMANTRTTRAGHIVKFLFWNASYHAEHHFAPGVPFFALPRLHHLLASSLESVAPSYRAAHADIRARLPSGGNQAVCSASP